LVILERIQLPRKINHLLYLTLKELVPQRPLRRVAAARVGPQESCNEVPEFRFRAKHAMEGLAFIHTSKGR
jgi:hypothetical protein